MQGAQRVPFSMCQRREDMIKLVSGAFQGTPASANRRREEYLEIQKVLLLTNAIKKQRESINGTS